MKSDAARRDLVNGRGEDARSKGIGLVEGGVACDRLTGMEEDGVIASSDVV